MVATKALLFAVLSAVLGSTVVAGAHINTDIHLSHRALNRDLSDGVVNPRALHRRCKARHTYAPEEPETTKKADPTTTKEKKPDPTPDKKPSNDAPKDNNNNNNNNNNGGGNSGGADGYFAGINHGDLTYFDTETGRAGACGEYSHNSDYLCAVSHTLFDSYPNGGSPCGRKIRLTVDGKSVTVTVKDRCAGCEPADIDLTPGPYASLGIEWGRIKTMTWQWV